MNNIQIIGFVGKDAESRNTQSGKKVTKFTVATSESYKDQNNEWQSNTTWHTVIAWGNLSEKIASRIKKGWKVYVSGKISHRTYEKEDGTTVYITEIVARTINQMVHMPKQSASSSFPSEPQKAINDIIKEDSAVDNDDLPF